MKTPKPDYLPYIDGLRAVAVLSVIFYHLNAKFLPGGFTGVDVFFVISGFVVSGSVGRLKDISFGDFVAYFYSRRLFRIAPALIICLIVTSLAQALFIPFAWLSLTNQKTGLAAFFGFSNFVLAQSSNDYFSPVADFNPFTHTWSLAVEEQFYLLFPLIFFAWLRNQKYLSVALAVAGFTCSFAWAWHLGAVNPGRAFYMLTTRFWELASGVLLFQFIESGSDKFVVLRKASWLGNFGASISAVLLCAGLVTAAPSSTPFPGGILPVTGTLGILGFLHGRPSSGVLLKLLEHKTARYTGKISYSLYLWHWPVFVLFRWTSGLQTITTEAAALAITFGLSILSYKLIETPPRKILTTLRLPRIAFVGIGLAGLLIGHEIAGGIWASQHVISFSTVTRNAADWYPDGGLKKSSGCTLQHPKTPVGGGYFFTFSRAGCAAPVTFPHDVFVIGDSHAFAYSAMLKAFALQTGATVHLYGFGGCSFINLMNVPTPMCDAFSNAAIVDMLAKIRPGDVVFLPSLRMPHIVEQYTYYGEAAAAAQMFSPVVAKIRNTGQIAALPVLQSFAHKGATVVFEAPTPEFKSPAFRCADWFDRSNPICSGGSVIDRAAITALRAPVMQIYSQFEAAIPAVKVWDPLPVLCAAAICSQYSNGRPLFFDGDHLSGYGDAMLLPSFENFIINLPPPPGRMQN